MKIVNTNDDITDRFFGQFANGFAYGFFNTMPMPRDFRILRDVIEAHEIKSFGGTAGLYTGVVIGLGWYASVAGSVVYGIPSLFEQK